MPTIRPLFPGSKFPSGDDNGVGGHTIADEGTTLTTRPTLDFVGAGVTVTDTTGKTVVNIPGGGGTGSAPAVLVATPSATQTVPASGAGTAGTNILLTWTQTSFSAPGTTMDMPTNTRFRALVAGWYDIDLSLRGDGIDLNAKLGGEIRINAGGSVSGGTRLTLIAGPIMPGVALTAPISTSRVIHYLNTNDYLEIFVYTNNDTAGGINIVADSSGAATRFSMSLINVGSKGDPGTQGLQGPQGPPGSASSYIHTQSISMATWNIIHNLGFYPAVSVVDSANSQVEGEVVYTSINALTITFSAGFSGKAYLS